MEVMIDKKTHIFFFYFSNPAYQDVLYSRKVNLNMVMIKMTFYDSFMIVGAYDSMIVLQILGGGVALITQLI